MFEGYLIYKVPKVSSLPKPRSHSNSSRHSLRWLRYHNLTDGKVQQKKEVRRVAAPIRRASTNGPAFTKARPSRPPLQTLLSPSLWPPKTRAAALLLPHRDPKQRDFPLPRYPHSTGVSPKGLVTIIRWCSGSLPHYLAPKQY